MTVVAFREPKKGGPFPIECRREHQTWIIACQSSLEKQALAAQRPEP